MIRHAVILAGGRGTRLGKLTDATPKPMMNVAGRPFLEHLVRHLVCEGMRRVTVIAGYLGEQIEAHFAETKIPRCEVDVLIEPEPLGTAGALRFAKDHLSDRFFLLNGDTFFDVPLAMLGLDIEKEDPVACIALRRVSDPGRYGVVLCDGARVSSFSARPREGAGAADINGGIYLLHKRILQDIGKGFVSLENDVFPNLVDQNLVTAKSFDEVFIDIGIPDDLDRAGKVVPDAMARSALFLDRDGVINKDINYLHRIEDFEWINGAQEAILWATQMRMHVFVVTNQAGVARGFYGVDDVERLHSWIEDQVCDIGGRISDFRFCPYHVDGVVPEFTGPHPWRKPQPGMLLDLIEHYAVIQDRSIMIGDNASDVQAAEAAGIRGVLFEGGNLADVVRSVT
ncbi:D-glycero-D-manno-heptose 1,7-bisphosphate phosphatase [Litoreibacter ponti]|uniref:D,D-heptose 1,7-bisphosphate phosphatase n=1 Tax=Litoreibacter ponti TaxID=1510457 RepID=A0A2T6BNW9_9RHOB|nr:HAD-IIIA family hydrolase [Litoreibacter ponti]PTX57734.1 D-glycero-D-manno-heptose 1,7-bisphosphate phosphatase [Litoreibacter ponti]